MPNMVEQIQNSKLFTGVRLPQTVRPLHYDITLEPNFKTFTFAGKVVIEYESCDVQEKHITLNAIELEISEGHITSSSLVSSSLAENDTLALKKVHYNKDNETASLEFESKPPAKGALSLKFNGILNDQLKGFYRSAIKIGDHTVYAATTQFEATDARRCLPCWDEPSIKASFSTTLIFPETMMAGERSVEVVGLSNMPVESVAKLSDNLKKVSYERSPKMSTYLLAFVIGPFECIMGNDGRRPIRIFTAFGKTEQAQYALDVACKTLRYYEDYFNVPYPLPKMDLIGIPDFCIGAMENWGLVTYRESCLLVDPGNTSTSRRQYVALIITHELAHSWFGNLVTMQWWTHLWLKEGFATFMEYLCTDHLFPEYKAFTQFVVDCYGGAMDQDSLHNSHPIEVPVKHPSEIREIFDNISYNKGSSVLRMLYNYIGDDCFRAGMREYLTNFAYSSTTTEDLWDSLEASSNKPVRKLMTCWTSQVNYPWLTVECSKLGDGDVKLILTQSKFTADGKHFDDDSEARWMIPISAITSNHPNVPQDICLLEGTTHEVIVKGVGDGWIKLNPGTIGLYRTAYCQELADKLLVAIRDQTMPPMDRLGLQDDLFALCKAGKVRTVELLNLLNAFVNETEFSVWSSIDGCLSHLSLLLANTSCIDKFRAFGRNLLESIFTKLGWEPQANEGDSSAMTRALLIGRLVSFKHQGIIDEAKRKFRALVDEAEPITADLRGAVYKAIALHGDDHDYDCLFDLHKRSDLHEEKDRIATAISSATDPARLERALEFVLSSEVRNQDKVYAIKPVGISNPPMAFQFLQDQKNYLMEMYTTSPLIVRVVKFVTENLQGEESAIAVREFFARNKFPGTERTVQQSIETIMLNTSWLARDISEIESYLAKI